MSDSPSSTPTNGYFVSGGTLSLSALSYIARDADSAVLTALEAGNYCYILNSRQLGKSSLCVRTKARLEADGVKTAFIDLTRIGGVNVNPEQWYTGMCGELGRALKLRAEFLSYLEEQKAVSPMQRFFGAIREVALERLDGPIVVFIDEIDAVQSLPFDMDEFFAGIRECFNRRVHDPVYHRLTFCLIGVAVPNALIKNPKTTPFNIGERIFLRDFTLDELTPFSSALGTNGRELLTRIHYWTNGHPFLTQSLCSVIARKPEIRTSRDIDALVASEFFQATSRETNVNLADVSNRIINVGSSSGDPEKFLADMLSAYESSLLGRELIDDEANTITGILKLSGLMRSQAGRLKVRNRIYERVFNKAWIRENMPGREVERQKKAYRRGILRATVVAALVLVGAGSLATYAFLQAKRANDLAVSLRLSSDNLKAALSKQEEATKSATASANAAMRAEGHANDLVKERDTALGSARAAATSERTARQIADARTKDALDAKHLAVESAARAKSAELMAQAKTLEAQLRSYDYYVANLKVAESSLASRQFDLARTVIGAMKSQPRRGWEYGILRRQLEVKDRALVGHRNALNDAGFSPDGKEVVTSDFSGQVMVWDTATCTKRRQYDFGMLTWSFAVSPNGRVAVTSARDGGVLAALDPTTGKRLWQIDTKAPKLNKIVFSRDGQIVAGAGPEGSVVFVNSTTGAVLKRFKVGDGELSSISICPSQPRFVVGCLDHNAYLCDSGTGKVVHTLSGHTEWVWGVAYSREGDKILTCSVDRTARLWDGGTGRMVSILSGHVDSVINGEISPDSKQWMTAADDNAAKLWDPQGRLLDTLGYHNGGVTSARFSPSGETVVTTSRDHKARLWDLDPTPGTRLVYQFQNRVMSVDAARNRPWVLAGSKGKAVLVDVDTAKVVRTFSISAESQVYGVALSPDAKWAAITDADHNVALVYEIASGKLVATLPGGFLVTRFSPDGKYLAIDNLNARAVDVYEVADWHIVKSLKGPSANVVDIQFSRDSKLVFGSSYDRSVHTWSLAAGGQSRPLGPFPGAVWPVAVSPDGTWIAAADNLGFYKVWDLRTLQLKCEGVALLGACEGLAFTSDSKEILATGIRGEMSVTSVPEGRELVTFRSNTGQNRRMSMFPDGRAAVAGGDGSVRIWEPLMKDLPISTQPRT